MAGEDGAGMVMLMDGICNERPRAMKVGLRGVRGLDCMPLSSLEAFKGSRISGEGARRPRLSDSDRFLPWAKIPASAGAVPDSTSMSIVEDVGWCSRSGPDD